MRHVNENKTFFEKQHTKAGSLLVALLDAHFENFSQGGYGIIYNTVRAPFLSFLLFFHPERSKISLNL